MRPRRSGEVGSMTVVMSFGVIALVFFAVVGLHFAQIAGLRHTASAAADLAALAGSRAAYDGDSGCVAARRIARANGAVLVRCRMNADVATVTARASMRRLLWSGRWRVDSRARAAPVEYLTDR